MKSSPKPPWESGGDHDRVISKGPCPRCGSKDNLVRYADGHAHCFSPSCGYWEKGESGGEGSNSPTILPQRSPHMSTKLLSPERPDAWDELSTRRLKSDTLRRFGYFTGSFKPAGKDTPIAVQVAPYYDQGGTLVAQKLRLPGKEFVVLKEPGAPGLTECQLFGRHVFGDRYDRRVVVTEGELDAMSVAQVADFKYATVSVGTGAEVTRNLQANYQWLDRFSEIILFFDDDERGHAATAAAAKLFAVGKVRCAKIPGCKDASEALQKNRPGDIEAAIYSATAWKPQGILNAADCLRVLAGDAPSKRGWTYPWPTLDAKTLGVRTKEVVFFVAGSGMGKTSGIYEVEHALLKQGVKIGHMGFEDTIEDVQLGIMSIAANWRMAINPLPHEEITKIHQEVFGSRNVEIFDQDTAEWSCEAILGYVRFLAKALGCKVVVIDPLTFIIAGMGGEVDERRMIDMVVQNLAKLSKELDIAILVSHHLARPKDGPAHEEGARISANQIRGSGAILQFAAIVIGWEGDLQGPAPNLRRLRIIKNRPIGASQCGESGILSYDDTTGRYVETDAEYPDRWAKRGKGNAPDSGTHGGFPTGTQDY